MNSTLKKHDEVLDEHDSEICHIRQDLIDIKTRLGIKDLTNGQVVEYQKQLVKAIEEEKSERKEQDAVLREDIKEQRNISWAIMTGVIFAILIEVVSIVGPKLIGG